MRKVHEENARSGRLGRLYGDETAQLQCGRVLRSIMSKVEVESLLDSPSMGFVGKKYANSYLEQIGKNIGPEAILEVADNTGITRDGYTTFWKKFKGAVKQVGSGIRISCLPNPHQVKLLRQGMNGKLEDLIGKHRHIDNTLVLQSGSKSKVKAQVKLELSQKNSFFADVEAVMRTMVRLYGFTLEGERSHP